MDNRKLVIVGIILAVLLPMWFVGMQGEPPSKEIEIWEVDLPKGASDLRGVPAYDRRDRVSEAFESVDAGDRLHIVSDRDPTPVRESLLELGDGNAIESFEVKRQNPETWLARTVVR